MEKYIAFQTVDSENDIWCNRSFLFETESDVEWFFSNPVNVLSKLEHELNEENGESFDSINYEIHRLGNKAKSINAITYSCEYAGNVKIVKMHEGFLIKRGL